MLGHEEPELAGELRRWFDHVDRTIRTICMGRVFGITDERYMSLFPQGTRPDDLICIPYGAPVPFVLRVLSEDTVHPIKHHLG
jgi:hypothetical protein